MMTVVQLTRRFGGRSAIQDLTFSACEGEILGLVGPNGSGKTTTARLLAGVLEPTSGHLSLYGRSPLRDAIEYRALIGYLPETAPAWGELRVREQLMQWAAIQGMPLRRSLLQMEWVLGVCGLEPCLERRIETLSRGYRQRVGLAMALLSNPKVMILDEPTAGLDPLQSETIRETILRLRQGRLIVIATHRVEDAEGVCTRLLVLHQGRLVADGTPDELRRRTGKTETLTAEIRGCRELVRERCRSLLFVEAVEVGGEEEWVRVTLRHRRGTDIRADLFRLAVREGWEIRELREERPPLPRVIASLLGGSP